MGKVREDVSSVTSEVAEVRKSVEPEARSHVQISASRHFLRTPLASFTYQIGGTC
jgi:hypothetical protein